jgi:hypothetical protein
MYKPKKYFFLLFPFSQMRKATHFVVLGHIYPIQDGRHSGRRAEGEQWHSGRAGGSGFESLPAHSVSVSLSKTLNTTCFSTQEYKWLPVIAGEVACDGPASHEVR